MEQINKRMVYEMSLLQFAFIDEKDKGVSNDGYSWYHENMRNLYSFLGSEYRQALGIPQELTTIDECIDFCKDLQLTAEQKNALRKVRVEPTFIKLMGETALSQKQELESVLGTTLTSAGKQFADENGVRTAIKSPIELDAEMQKNNDKLNELRDSGTISEEQFQSYVQLLDYIFVYFDSQSKGNQLCYRKISDSQIEKIKEEAEYEGIEFDEMLRRKNSDLADDFQDLQDTAHKSR